MCIDMPFFMVELSNLLDLRISMKMIRCELIMLVFMGQRGYSQTAGILFALVDICISNTPMRLSTGETLWRM